MTVVATVAVGRQRQDHIPAANPFVTKLAGIAAEVVRQQDCDVIFAYYFEPYGMAGHLASVWTDRPLVCSTPAATGRISFPTRT